MGDITGDGIGDLMAGRPNSYVSPYYGDAFVVFGSSGGPSNFTEPPAAGAGFTIRGAEASDKFGKAVSAAGDVNGDGFNDIVVSAYRTDGAGVDRGAVYVIFGPF